MKKNFNLCSEFRAHKLSRTPTFDWRSFSAHKPLCVKDFAHFCALLRTQTFAHQTFERIDFCIHQLKRTQTFARINFCIHQLSSTQNFRAKQLSCTSSFAHINFGALQLSRTQTATTTATNKIASFNRKKHR